MDLRSGQKIQEGFNDETGKDSSRKDELDALVSTKNASFLAIKETLQKPTAESEEALAALWHMLLETAKALDKDDPSQQQLVSLLLGTKFRKEHDALRRSLHPADNSSAESQQFADSVQESWEQLLMTPGTVSQQCNLAAFSATALAVGICHNLLGLTALWYLRETIETDGEKAISLLPAAVVWIRTCSHKLLTFSTNNQSYEEHPKAHLLTPGALARDAGIDQHGFSLERWVFWRQRFQKLSQSSDPAVAKEAKNGFRAMVLCDGQMGYDVPDEANFEEKLHSAMEEALVESGKKSVDSDEIDINADRVDQAAL